MLGSTNFPPCKARHQNRVFPQPVLLVPSSTLLKLGLSAPACETCFLRRKASLKNPAFPCASGVNRPEIPDQCPALSVLQIAFAHNFSLRIPSKFGRAVFQSHSECRVHSQAAGGHAKALQTPRQRCTPSSGQTSALMASSGCLKPGPPRFRGNRELRFI